MNKKHRKYKWKMTNIKLQKIQSVDNVKLIEKLQHIFKIKLKQKQIQAHI